jgi:hypothetical protein
MLLQGTAEAGKRHTTKSNISFKSNENRVTHREVLTSRTATSFQDIAIMEAESGRYDEHRFSAKQVQTLTRSDRKIFVGVGTSHSNVCKPPGHMGRMYRVAEHYSSSNNKLAIIWAN